MGTFIEVFYCSSKWVEVLFIIEVHEEFCCMFLRTGKLRLSYTMWIEEGTGTRDYVKNEEELRYKNHI